MIEEDTNSTIALRYAGAMRALATTLLLLCPSLTWAAPTDLSYDLEVRIRSFKVDADLLAGARLEMDATPHAGGTRLVLRRPVEHPWKFYWVAPVVGREEVKFASEVSLPAATWDARKKADAAADRRGRELWSKWQKEWKGKRAFDQAFSFYVIGSPRGRFVVEAPAGGGVSKANNRVTDRWLPTGFPDWVAGKKVEGYAFWADDPSPPEWEPHTYDALAAAVKLLSTPVREGEVVHPDVAGAARQVLETLVPKTKGQFGGRADVPLTMTASTEGERRVLEGTSAPVKVAGQSGMSLVLHRRTVLEADGRPLSDHARVELKKGSELSLKLSVGWGP